MTSSHPVARSSKLIRTGCDILTSKGKEPAWSDPETYIELLRDQSVSIAVTNDGLADSVQVVNGEKVFVKPLNEEMDMPTFLSKLGAYFFCSTLDCAESRFSGVRLRRDRLPPIARWQYLPTPTSSRQPTGVAGIANVHPTRSGMDGGSPR